MKSPAMPCQEEIKRILLGSAISGTKRPFIIISQVSAPGKSPELIRLSMLFGAWPAPREQRITWDVNPEPLIDPIDDAEKIARCDIDVWISEHYRELGYSSSSEMNPLSWDNCTLRPHDALKLIRRIDLTLIKDMTASVRIRELCEREMSMRQLIGRED